MKMKFKSGLATKEVTSECMFSRLELSMAAESRHLLCWASGEATNSLFHVYNMGNSQSNTVLMGCQTVSNQSQEIQIVLGKVTYPNEFDLRRQ